MADLPLAVPEPKTDTSIGNTQTSTPAVISTSSASRAEYANNTSTLNGALANLTPASSPAASEKPTMSATPSITINTGDGTTKPTTNADGSTILNADGTNPHDASGYDPAKDPASSAYVDPKSGVIGAQKSGGDGTGGTLDPVIKGQFDTAGQQIDQGIATAQANLDAVTATLNNDPAAQAAVTQIQAQYKALYDAMVAHNKIVLGGYTVSAARSGGLQYANDMTTQFLNKEQEYASDRLMKITTEESNAVLKSNAAFKAGDVKAFSTASAALKSAQAEKTSLIGKLATATHQAVTEYQAKVRLAQSETTAALARDTKTSLALATGIVQNIAQYDFKDEKEKQQYIQAVAEEHGITDSSILESAVAKAQMAKDKTDLSAKNTESIINKRGQTGPAKGGDYKFNAKSTKNLYGAGATAGDVKILQQAIGKYGAKAVHDSPNTPDSVKVILESEFGL